MDQNFAQIQFKEFVIRLATNKDIPAIKNIVFTVLEEYGLPPNGGGKDNDLDDIEKNYLNSAGFFGVAEDINTQKIVGTFGLFRYNDDTCELRKMYLQKSVRGKGLGKFLLTTTIETARKKNFKKIILETIAPLIEARALYKQFGFIEIAPKEINERVDSAFELYIG